VYDVAAASTRIESPDNTITAARDKTTLNFDLREMALCVFMCGFEIRFLSSSMISLDEPIARYVVSIFDNAAVRIPDLDKAVQRVIGVRCRRGIDTHGKS
jgi:hypothetical protein